MPIGQRKKFNFPDEAPPEASVLTPEGKRHYAKELSEKRNEIELLKAELAARNVTDSAGRAWHTLLATSQSPAASSRCCSPR